MVALRCLREKPRNPLEETSSLTLPPLAFHFVKVAGKLEFAKSTTVLLCPKPKPPLPSLRMELAMPPNNVQTLSAFPFGINQKLFFALFGTGNVGKGAKIGITCPRRKRVEWWFVFFRFSSHK